MNSSSRELSPSAGSALEEMIHQCATWNGAVAAARKAIWDDGRGMIGRRNRDQLENRVARAIQRVAVAVLQCNAPVDDVPGMNTESTPDQQEGDQ